MTEGAGRSYPPFHPPLIHLPLSSSSPFFSFAFTAVALSVAVYTLIAFPFEFGRSDPAGLGGGSATGSCEHRGRRTDAWSETELKVVDRRRPRPLSAGAPLRRLAPASRSSSCELDPLPPVSAAPSSKPLPDRKTMSPSRSRRPSRCRGSRRG
jgi:hypothetical protein